MYVKYVILSKQPHVSLFFGGVSQWSNISLCLTTTYTCGCLFAILRKFLIVNFKEQKHKYKLRLLYPWCRHQEIALYQYCILLLALKKCCWSWLDNSGWIEWNKRLGKRSNTLGVTACFNAPKHGLCIILVLLHMLKCIESFGNPKWLIKMLIERLT
jgi:hypothetical protein